MINELLEMREEVEKEILFANAKMTVIDSLIEKEKKKENAEIITEDII